MACSALSRRVGHGLWQYFSYVVLDSGESSGTVAFNGDEETTFDEAVASMKQAYRERLNWMNTNIMNRSFVIDAE